MSKEVYDERRAIKKFKINFLNTHKASLHEILDKLK